MSDFSFETDAFLVVIRSCGNMVGHRDAQRCDDHPNTRAFNQYLSSEPLLCSDKVDASPDCDIFGELHLYRHAPRVCQTCPQDSVGEQVTEQHLVSDYQNVTFAPCKLFTYVLLGEAFNSLEQALQHSGRPISAKYSVFDERFAGQRPAHLLVFDERISCQADMKDMAESPNVVPFQLLSVSGIVIIHERGNEILLSLTGAIQRCLDRRGETELKLLHTAMKRVSSDRLENGDLAHCLIFGPQDGAQLFLSSLQLHESYVDTAKLSTYPAELPTCLWCLQRIDPVSIGMIPMQQCRPSSYTPQLPPYKDRQDCLTCERVGTYHRQHQRAAMTVPGRPPWLSSQPPQACESRLPSSQAGPDTIEYLSCQTCQIPENLWICLLCAHIGCGRYTAEHAKQHFQQTKHIYSLELATGRVWDYVEDIFVHSLRQCSQHQGMLHIGECDFARDTRNSAADISEYEESKYDAASAMGKVRRGKLENLDAEYSALLTSQLEEQSLYYERLLAKTAAELMQEHCETQHISGTERREAGQLQKLVCCLEAEHEQAITDLRAKEEQSRQLRAKNDESLQAQKGQKKTLQGLRRASEQVRADYAAHLEELQSQLSDLKFSLKTQQDVLSQPLLRELEGGEIHIQSVQEEHAHTTSSVRERLRRRLNRQRR